MVFVDSCCVWSLCVVVVCGYYLWLWGVVVVWLCVVEGCGCCVWLLFVVVG